MPYNTINNDIQLLKYLIIIILFLPKYLQAWELSGYVGVESLGFLVAPLNDQQHTHYLSGVIQPELIHQWDNSQQQFAFEPFYRYSQFDNRRTHFDIRELNWLKISDNWELRIGISRVFWGSTESEHLVDIVNQTDLVEDLNMEAKLGQPMVNLTLIREWGNLSMFLLPGFRERTFSGSEGRFNSSPSLDVANTQFGGQGIAKELSFATRWSKSLGNWDWGLSGFHGISREPSVLYVPSITGLKIVPQYPKIQQVGLDLQVVQENLIWKLESIVRSGQGPTYNASVGGLEYGFYSIFDSNVDLGLVTEYMYDTRGTRPFKLELEELTKSHQLIVFQNDFTTGIRIGLNDTQNSEAFIGGTFDVTTSEKFYTMNVKRRLIDNIQMRVEVKFYNNKVINDATYFLRGDNYIRTDLNYLF